MQKIIITNPSDAGQRIDRFCKKYLPNAALGGIYKMLRTGKIKLNGKKKDPTYKLELQDQLTFWISDEELHQLQNTSLVEPRDPGKSPLSVEDILYEDEHLMIINKPFGINVHAGDHKSVESNLIDQIHDYLRGRYDSLTFRPALVHRLDRDTSGCIMIAKDKNTLEILLHDLQSHAIEKIYHAYTFGVPQKANDVIRARLLRVEDAQNEAKVQVDPLGQVAVTHYRVISRSALLIQDSQHQSTIPISLIECRLETGRTHQIRVHLSHISTPIIADKAYGNKKLNSYVSRQFSIHRQLLHARKLVFIHPITKKSLTIEAPYPVDFLSLIQNTNCI